MSAQAFIEFKLHEITPMFVRNLASLKDEP